MTRRILIFYLFGFFSSSQGNNFSVINQIVESRDSKGYHQPEHHHHYDTPVGHHGGGSFQSFFDIALTGLAFLSFGIFLLNLLLNALIGAGYVTGTVLPTNTGTGIITNTATGTGTGTGTATGTATGTTTSRAGRIKREVELDLQLDPVSSMDAMAHVVLKSIDAMVQKHECVNKVFCDGNKEARIVGTGFQYLMPAYSLGASYIGRKIGLHDCIPDHLGAILHGIEESNCQSEYPQC